MHQKDNPIRYLALFSILRVCDGINNEKLVIKTFFIGLLEIEATRP
jgi:hypothetical protein